MSEKGKITKVEAHAMSQEIERQYLSDLEGLGKQKMELAKKMQSASSEEKKEMMGTYNELLKKEVDRHDQYSLDIRLDSFEVE